MASDNIFFDQQSTHGRLLRQGLSQLETGLDTLNNVLENLPHMIDGDGTSVTHFNEVVTRYGFADTTAAKAAWDELNSMMAKLNTDTSVTSVNAAMLQAFAKMR